MRCFQYSSEIVQLLFHFYWTLEFEDISDTMADPPLFIVMDIPSRMKAVGEVDLNLVFRTYSRYSRALSPLFLVMDRSSKEPFIDQII